MYVHIYATIHKEHVRSSEYTSLTSLYTKIISACIAARPVVMRQNVASLDTQRIGKKTIFDNNRVSAFFA